jgi:putative hydrolase of the HAD superfamily
VDFDWTSYHGVIFDLDGTLYMQRRLRQRMMLRLALELGPRPSRWREIKILRHFRTMREELADRDVKGIARLQYEETARALNLSPKAVEQVVAHWIHAAPLPYLRRRRAPGVKRFWDQLNAQGIKLAVCSDYPVDGKLQALGLTAPVTVCSEEPEVNVLKPNPSGLLLAARRMDLEPDACLVIGDRPERDGEAAKRAGMNFLLFAPQALNCRKCISSYVDIDISA